MATEVIDQTKLEAICRSCSKSFAFPRSNLNQIVVCKNCGFSSFLSPDRILKKIPVFTQNNPITVVKKENLKYIFRFFRHGADSPQLGVILELTTLTVKFTTLVHLDMGSKIVFLLKNKKFIVVVRQIDMARPATRDGTNVIQYEINASIETALTGVLKEKIYNPHYIIK